MQRQPLTTSHYQTGAQTVSEQQLLWKTLPARGLVLLLSVMLWVQLVPFITWVSCPGCFPSQSLVHPQPVCWGWGGQSEKQRQPWCCASPVQWWLKHWCAASPLFITNTAPTGHCGKSCLHLSQSHHRAWSAIWEILKLALSLNKGGCKCSVQSVRRTITSLLWLTFSPLWSK